MILELQKIVREKMKGYVRTIQGDAELLNSGSLGYNEQNATIITYTEK